MHFSPSSNRFFALEIRFVNFKTQFLLISLWGSCHWLQNRKISHIQLCRHQRGVKCSV